MKISKVLLLIAVLISPMLTEASDQGSSVNAQNEALLISQLKGSTSEATRSSALAKLSGYYLSIGRLEKAVDNYRRMINDGKILKKEKYKYYQLIGDIYFDVKDYSSAIEYYQEAINIFPRIEEARLKLAKVYEASELNELAKQAYLDDLKNNKNSFLANFSLASLYMKLGLNTQALDHCLRALAIRHDSALYRQTALCAEVSGDVSLALAMLRQIPQEQRTLDDLISLGRIYADIGKVKEAEESFSQAIKTNTENIESYLYLALLYLDNNNYKPAEKLLLIALEKYPNEASIHFFLGCIYNAQGRTVIAREEMLKSATLSKTDILNTYSRKFMGYISNASK